MSSFFFPSTPPTVIMNGYYKYETDGLTVRIIPTSMPRAYYIFGVFGAIVVWISGSLFLWLGVPLATNIKLVLLALGAMIGLPSLIVFPWMWMKQVDDAHRSGPPLLQLSADGELEFSDGKIRRQDVGKIRFLRGDIASELTPTVRPLVQVLIEPADADAEPIHVASVMCFGHYVRWSLRKFAEHAGFPLVEEKVPKSAAPSTQELKQLARGC